MNQDTFTKDLIPLIAIPSIASDAAALQAAVDYIEAYIKQRVNVTIERFERNGKPSLLAYTSATRPARFDVILNGHLDVVPGRIEQYTAKIVGNELHGRGTFDMKAAALVETDVFCAAAGKVPYALALQIVADEEIGGYDGAKYQIEQGVRADFTVIGEHALASNVIYNEARGLCWVELAFRGKTAHGGYPWNGENALLKASRFAHAVLEEYPIPKREVWGTTANIASIKTNNNAHNAVPEDARLHIDFRFTAEDPVFHSVDSVKAFLKSIDPDVEILAIPVWDPAISVDPEHPALHALVRALEHTSGKPVRFDRRYAGGDARHYAALGDSAVEFGLSGGHMHGSDEFVDLTSIQPYWQTLYEFLTQTYKPNSVNEQAHDTSQTNRHRNPAPTSRISDRNRAHYRDEQGTPVH